ncbi:MAG: EAL domain-containing protein [Lachnospiraceae bacterium]|nr:EAL domain-containing protein [Lachnospiraceae bacterium]
MTGMNVAAQVSGLVLLLAIILLYISQRRLGLRSEKTFLALWIVVFLNIVGDIVANYAFYNRGESTTAALVTLKIYLLGNVVIGLALFVYFCGEMVTELSSSKVMIAVVALFFLASTGMLVLESNGVNRDPVGEWTRLMKIVSVIMAIIFVAMTVFTLFRRKAVRAVQKRVMFFFIAGWIVSAGIQVIFSGLTTNSFFCALGILVIYSKLENPQGYTDVVSGMFNQTGFIRYCSEHLKRGRELAMLCIELDKKSMDNIPSDKSEDIMKALISCFIETPGAFAFKMPEDRVILVFNGKKELRVGYEYLKKMFSGTWDAEGEVSLKNVYIEIPFDELGIRLEDINQVIMFASQTIGKNRHMVVDKAFIEKMHQSHMVRDIIDEALEEDRIEVFYQPIFSISKQRFVSAEALVRIRNKDGSLTFPNDFIPVAEKSEQIIKLGEKVFEKVCEFISKEDVSRKGIEYIEVNLSVVQCDYLFLANTFMEIMRRFNVNPRMINLEITESAELSDKETMIRNIDVLRSCGVRFSLDDFGTGQSNLNYIVDMPVDIVKFDREMTWSYFENTKAKYVMETSVSMIHGMDLQIVTEGVENEKQYHILKELGIDFIQGYYLSKPLSSGSFLEFMGLG